MTQGHGLLHGEEQVVFADAGYLGACKRTDTMGVQWRPGKRKTQKHTPWGAITELVEKLKASVQAKVRYHGLAKNTAQLITMFALSNIRMLRSRLMQRAQT